jgi:hypothetical protein
MRHRKLTEHLVLPALLLAIGLAAPVAAEDPPQEEPEQTQTEEQAAKRAEAAEKTPEQQQEMPALGSARGTEKGSSLAAAAGKITLQKPADGSSGIVISDQNLKTAGQKGAVSQGTGQAAASSPAAAAPGTAAPGEAAANPQNELAARLEQQKLRVQELEERLANLDRQLAEKEQRDPHYRYYHNSPQNRAGGVQDEVQGQRDLLAQELETARTELDRTEAQARRAGITTR